jgi:hypothetical protein
MLFKHNMRQNKGIEVIAKHMKIYEKRCTVYIERFKELESVSMR